MINTQLEEIVSLALDAYLNADGDRNKFEHISNFELQLRRLLMQKYCNTFTSPKQHTHTYTITAGEGVMGNWTTSKQQLNG